MRAWREAERPKRDSGMPTPRPPSQAGRRQRERRAKMREPTGWSAAARTRGVKSHDTSDDDAHGGGKEGRKEE